MPLARISIVSGTAVSVPGDDVDTDRIIPARFMRCVTFDGLGQYLFNDVRTDPTTGKTLNHPVDDPARKGAPILVVGMNFGCGSSREHAPQAIQKFGFKAIIGGGFAEIFFGNSTTLGIPCVALSKPHLDTLHAAVSNDPNLHVVIDLKEKFVFYGKTPLDAKNGSGKAPLTIKEGARQALLEGEWDAIGLLLEGKEQVAKLEATLH